MRLDRLLNHLKNGQRYSLCVRYSMDNRYDIDDN
jgi:hypothetical protein